MVNYPVIYEVPAKQNLHSILDIYAALGAHVHVLLLFEVMFFCSMSGSTTEKGRELGVKGI